MTGNSLGNIQFSGVTLEVLDSDIPLTIKEDQNEKKRWE